MRRAHTPPSSTPSPSSPGDGPPIDLVAGDPPVPITVWRTPAGHEDQASIPGRLAERLVAAYSRPGEIVVDVTDDAALASPCASGGRRYRRAAFTSRSALIVRPDTIPDTGSTRPEPRTRGREEGPQEIAAWFGDDLTDPALPPTDATAPTLADPVAGGTSLVVATWPLHAVDATNQVRLRWLLHAAAGLLRAGGCLVLVVRAPAGAVATPEDFGPLISAARGMRLGYLQHIVAVRAQVDGDQFSYYATDEEIAALAAAGQLALALAAATGPLAAVHVRVHADLLVFTPQQNPASSAKPSGGGVRG